MSLLHDRVAVVTGAGRGIGRAIALRFAEEGAHLVLNDLDPEPLAEVLARCGPGRALAVPGDITTPGVAEALMAAAVQELGGLDILVNNAGLTRDRVIHRMSDADWETVLNVNLTGAFRCARAAAHHFRAQAQAEQDTHGAVQRTRKLVNLYSTAAIRGNPGQVNYAAAKMGLVGMTRALAQEWARYRVCVNAVAPGFIDTRLTQERAEGSPVGMSPEAREATLARIPFGRPGQPREVADAVLFFASPMSDFITGQELNVSGGMQIP